MSAIVMKALAKEACERYQTAAEMIRALDDPAAIEETSQPDGSVHAFSTAALAAASSAMNGVASQPTVVMPAPETRIAATVPLPAVVKSSGHKRRYVIAAVGFLLVAASFFAYHRSTAREAVELSTPAPPIATPPAVLHPVRTHSRPATARPASKAAVPDKVRSEELTALGYRHLQQRDYESAQDDFTQALELDPRNAAAKRGLQVSQGAQTVDTLSGVLRH